MDSESVVARPGPLLGGAGAGLWRGVVRVVANPVSRIVFRRLLLSIPLLFFVTFVTFFLMWLTPGDAATASLNQTDVYNPAAIAKVRHELHLDLPMVQQYWLWLKGVLTGNFGHGFNDGQPVTDVLQQRYPTTLSLILVSIFFIVLIGVALGVFSAVRGGFVGRFVDGLSLVGFALPPFWVGAVLISIFAVKLRWLPAVGFVPLSQSPGDWARSLILPVAALAIHSIAVMAKQTREAMMDVLASEHIRMAWANGIRPRKIYYRLALKAASMRVVTVAGLQVVGLLSATIFIEYVFSLPGLGSSLIEAAHNGNTPTTEGIVLVFTLVIVIVNLIVDLAYGLLDPRVRAS
jgi:peptide/nickel transport system permease protein